MGSGKTISDPGEQAKMREAMLRLGCFTSLDAVLAVSRARLLSVTTADDQVRLGLWEL